MAASNDETARSDADKRRRRTWVNWTLALLTIPRNDMNAARNCDGRYGEGSSGRSSWNGCCVLIARSSRKRADR